jgi:hypothetical protein
MRTPGKFFVISFGNTLSEMRFAKCTPMRVGRRIVPATTPSQVTWFVSPCRGATGGFLIRARGGLPGGEY